MKQNYTNSENDISHHLGRISIDSLKIRIPIDKCQIIDESILSDKYVIDANSGAIEKEYKQNRYSHKSDGITTSIGIEHQVTAGQKVKEYLVLLINSKLLQSRYFEGLTIDNIETVYYRLMGLKLVKFSYESFLAGECTDVDYKKDLYAGDFDKAVKLMHLHARPSKKLGVGCNAFTQRNNKGIEFGKRETATPATPFLKVYHKGIELLNNSKEFNRKFLRDINVDLEKLVRVETTIKNKKHFRRYGVDNTSLNSILKINDTTLDSIFKEVMRLHLEKRITTPKAPADMKPADAVHFASITSLMDVGISYNAIRETLVNGIGCKVSRSRMRGKLDKIYDGSIAGGKIDKANKENESLFQAMGWE